MRNIIHLSNRSISIVIPNARAYPAILVDQLHRQCTENDEIIVVRNSHRSSSNHWVGISYSSKSSLSPGTEADTSILTYSCAVKKAPNVFTIHLQDNMGAAAARNLGWRTAKNNLILFLDDDIMVDDGFLFDIRLYLEHHPFAGVVTFRVNNNSSSRLSPLVKATITLDRGPEIRNTGNTNLKLHNVWMYGAGATMLVDRNVLTATGGFKNLLGAGCKYGGTEDTEFLWHASFHTSIEYCGSISVRHKDASTFYEVARKMNEYGRAIGFLGGMIKNMQGLRYVFGYCSHLERCLYFNNQNFEIELNLLKNAVFFAIIETLKVYEYSLTNCPCKNVLCDNCRRGLREELACILLFLPR